MKKSFTSFALASALFGLATFQANAQTDVTKYFLDNYLFDSDFDYPASSTQNVAQEIKEIPGWTKNFSIDYTITGIYEFGFQGQFNNGTVPAVGYDNEAGGALCLSTGWGNAFGYTQEVTLPAGKYTLKVPTYNGKTVTGGVSDLQWIPNSGSAVKSTTSVFPSKQWTLDQITFTLTETTSGKIQVGYVAAEGGSANSANLVIDYVTLLVQDMDKSTLKAAIDEATTLYGNGSGNGAAALKSAIDAAKAVYDNASASPIEILEAEKALRAAIEIYHQNNISEESPLDVTAQYLVNPSFEDGTNGWSVSDLKSQSNNDFPKKAGSIYYEKWVSEGNKVGNASAVQTVTLPAGKYLLKVGAQNYDQRNKSAECSGAVIFAGTEETPVYTPNDYSVKFISLGNQMKIGFRAVEATGNWLAVDNFRLYLIGEADGEAILASVQELVAQAEALVGKMMNGQAAADLNAAIEAGKAITASSKVEDAAAAIEKLEAAIAAAEKSIAEYAALQEAIDKAEAAYDASKNGAADFKAEIDAAKALVADPDASSEDLAAEIAALETAALAFNMANATGDTPKVVGNPYIARGCRIAFGRLEVEKGVTTVEQGFCYSETNKYPTVLDNRASTYYTHNGKIFYMKDIKPATTYYVRAYAISNGYKVGYGEPVKIVTLPEATCTWSWNRNNASDEEDARCQAAIAEAMEDYNYCSAFKGFHLTGNYQPGAGAGDGTADCSYGGWMRISQNAAYQRTGTVQHETNHGVGVGTTSRWQNNADLRADVTRGYWRGRRANELVNFFENTNGTMTVTGDGTHMWVVNKEGSTSGVLNYGINGAHEDNGSKLLYFANAILTEFLCEDGLNPTSAYLNGVPCYTYTHDENQRYYLVSENAERGLNTAGFLREVDGNKVGWKSVSNVDDDHCAWYLEYLPEEGYYMLKNAATGNYLRMNRGGALTVATPSTSNEKMQLMPGRLDMTVGTGDNAITSYGYWITTVYQSNTIFALEAQAAADGASEGEVKAIKHNFSDGATQQRWIIMSKDQLEAYKAATGLTDFNSITAPESESLRTVAGIYSIDGVKLPRVAKGVNIIRYSDGTTEKIIAQ